MSDTKTLFRFYVIAYLITAILGLRCCNSLNREAELPARVESSCIDGVLVVADGNVIGCVNSSQSANQMWIPNK
jgi:hypothetical protein